MKKNEKNIKKANSEIVAFNKPVFVFFIIIVLTLIIYGNTFFFDYNLDDNYYLELLQNNEDNIISIFKNSFLSIFNSTQYRPVTTLTLALEAFFLGQSPRVFHFFNVLYYIILVINIYKLLKEFNLFTESKYILFISILFLIHPIHVEVVASIKNRESILSLLFCVLSLRAANDAIKNESIIKMILFAFFLTLSILSKIDCITIFLGIGFLLYFNAGINKRWLLSISVISFILILIINNAMETQIRESINIEQYSFVDEAENPMAFVSSLFEKIPMTFGTLGYYIKLNLLPIGYYFYYGTNMIEISSLKNTTVLVSAMLFLFILFYFAYNLYHKKNKTILLGITWFFIALVPFLNLLVPVAGIVAVRYSFAASLGFAVIISGFYFLLFEKLYTKLNLNKHIFWLPLIIYIPFTIMESKQWKDMDTLIASDIEYMNKSVVGNRIAAARYYQLSMDNSYDKKNLLEKSLQYCNTGLHNYNKDAELLNLKGKVLISLERFDEAEQVLKFGLADSTNRKGINILVSLLLKQNKKSEAEDLLLKAIKDKKIEESLYQLNDIYFKEDSIEKAIILNNSLINDTKLKKTANQLLGDCFLMKSDTLVAIDYYERAFAYGYKNKSLMDEIIKFLDSKKLTEKANSFKRFNQE